MFDLKDILSKNIKIISNSISRFFKKFVKKIKKLSNIKRHSAKFTKKAVKKVLGFLRGDNKSLKDYFQFGNLLISKKLAVIIIIICIAAPILFTRYALPPIRERFWTPSFYFNSPDIENYTGRANILASNSQVVYVGDIVEGKCTGKGRLYDLEGSLVYVGEFLLNNFSGKGKLHHDGNVLFNGEFLLNKYNGEGQLFDESGTPIYHGTFKDGEYNGHGTKYYPDGTMKYQGTFKDGLFEGEGTYYEDGMIRYTGGFRNGAYSQKGTLYDEYSRKKFTGYFENNLYHGEGKEFFPDGTIKYTGTFTLGKYNGQGKLYDYEKNTMVYQGNFADGIYNGLGKLYNTENGRLVYDGEFKNGLFDGLGTIYGINGRELFNGPFKDGNIDFFYLLGKPVTDLDNVFLTPNTISMQHDLVCITYEDMNLSLVLYMEEEDEALLDDTSLTVNEVILWGDVNISEINNSMALEDFILIHGEPLYSGYTYLTFEDELVLSNILKNNSIDLDQIPDEIYLAHFKGEEYSFSAFFKGEAEEFLYLIIK
ncbi:hypothetical protein RBH29_02760 [Herbivorax sp. ANBcel31]|uniref:MORN repeat-containing protein n=1 Tax=Herbivorax sp. ANBcel31 TaxID=3069754 RepID=UPI0027B5A7AF|nr:hypothetical protein [Herbivorax sp. ANBcel31]MDQ2085359.1 hypothetical protein [Herbivorax sp. ANBcel31]